MSLSLFLTAPIQKALIELFDVTFDKIEFQATRKEFEGDITLVLFPFLKQIKSNPAEIGKKLGDYLVANTNEVSSFNIVSGFLNIVIADEYYTSFFNSIKENPQFGFVTPNQRLWLNILHPIPTNLCISDMFETIF
jgi:arginyl-tRNA synthetase